MLTSEQRRKQKKIRFTEYYDLQKTFDVLYEKSRMGYQFCNLLDLITTRENILLAYRSLKGNSGSNTPGVDKRTIQHLSKMDEETFIGLVRKQFNWYCPKKVRRVEIPKPNGKLRPLGIPTIMDRIVQQCILQVLEPICEAKFYEHSYGFRPNRSTEQAIARLYQLVQKTHLHYVVDVDIKGFFDNVCHHKLICQLWSLGIQDKKLLCIIREMLKAPILLPDGKVVYPTKGTPQGGILSPLLSNVVLNELDWWIASQWEYMETEHDYAHLNKNGSINRGNQYRALRRSNLKEVFIVRYADDFKIVCKNYDSAKRIFLAVKQWLKERLRLEISPEKSKIVNLRKKYSDFLGFKIRVWRKGNKFVVKSHIADKAIERIKRNLAEGIKKIQYPKDSQKQYAAISYYNSIVAGIHNYYQIATCVNLDLSLIAPAINKQFKNRLASQGLSKKGVLKNSYIKCHYGKSKQIRFLKGFPLIPIGYIKHRHPISKKREVNRYTDSGRKQIHNNLEIDVKTMLWLMRHPLTSHSIEYADNRISLFAAQYGLCGVTNKKLLPQEIHCHHIKPLHKGGNDKYDNLIIVDERIHELIHATQAVTIEQLLNELQLTGYQLNKLNALRAEAELPVI